MEMSRSTNLTKMSRNDDIDKYFLKSCKKIKLIKKKYIYYLYYNLFIFYVSCKFLRYNRNIDSSFMSMSIYTKYISWNVDT